MKTILAAIDFSDVSDSVLQTAQELARAYGAKLRILHAAAPNPEFVGYEAGPQHERDFRAKILRQEHAKLNEIAERIRGQGIDAVALLEQGSTVEVLEKEIEDSEVDMVVMGSHGHGALFNLVAGSVTQAALKALKIPIVVVPADTD